MPNGRHREIVEAERFTRERAQISKDVPRWDSVLRGLHWVLSRDPERVGSPTDHEDILAVATDTWPDAPPVVVYYSFSDERVVLESIVPAPDEAES